MVHHGIAYGKGLQLINILRDQARDISEGRCYLPEDELRAAGLATLTWPAADWTPWHAVRRHWLSSARSGLQSGRVYVRNLRSLRLRFASLLPPYR